MNVRHLQDARIVVRLHACPHGDDATRVVIAKLWWGGPGKGGHNRELHDFCVPNQNGLETERIARGLEAAAAALRG